MNTVRASSAVLVALLATGVVDARLPEPQRPLIGELVDPVGDVKPNPRMLTPPDLVRARLEVRDGVLTITVSFAPGTLSRQTTLNIYLDTDDNPRTGSVVFVRDKTPVGADYEITPLQPQDPARAALRRHTSPTDSQFAGLLDVTSPTADQRQVALPLSRLGNDDGQMTFKLECHHIFESTMSGQSSTQTIFSHVDVMPNLGGRPGIVRIR